MKFQLQNTIMGEIRLLLSHFSCNKYISFRKVIYFFQLLNAVEIVKLCLAAVVF